VGVTHGELHVAVAQEFLDRPEAYPSHHQVRGKCVPQIMKAEVNDPDLAAGGFEGIPDVVEPFPVLVAENIGRFELMPPARHPTPEMPGNYFLGGLSSGGFCWPIGQLFDRDGRKD
jgi:hypothetical protein